MSRNYQVRLAKDNMVFSAAHFITFNGNVCERLHGHNYRVRVDVAGQLDENQYVIDFIALRDTLQTIVNQLDHYTLLPTNHPLIKVVPNGREVEVTFDDRRWVFPRGDCMLLPIANTTAELLARYIGERLQADFAQRTGIRLSQLTVGVDENAGQWGVCELVDE